MKQEFRDGLLESSFPDIVVAVLEASGGLPKNSSYSDLPWLLATILLNQQYKDQPLPTDGQDDPKVLVARRAESEKRNKIYEGLVAKYSKSDR